MNEQEAISRMIAPGTVRAGKYRGGIIQVHVTRACDKTCYGCTQGSNLRGKADFITLDNFERACESLVGYYGVVGVFGGNPALHPQFEDLCTLLAKYIPKEQRGLWCNHPVGKGVIMRDTFNPRVSNLNVHLDVAAYHEFKRDWPECHPIGLTQDSRHSPPYVAMRDVLLKTCGKCQGKGEGTWDHDTGCTLPVIPCDNCGGSGKVYDEAMAWELIADCDINKHWSAMVGQFRGQLRAWFCEIAGAQSILHQDDPDYPDTGIDPSKEYDFRLGDFRHRLLEHERMTDPGEAVIDCDFPYVPWWQLVMHHFRHQVRKHCHECGVPLRGHGELAQSMDGTEQVSATHQSIYKPKRTGRAVELVTTMAQLGKPLNRMTDYLRNANV